MIKKQYVLPALFIGVAMLGGGTALAFGPGPFSMEAFSSFSSDEQAAIQEAHDIRMAAEEEARSVLEAAGVTQDEMHEAMRAYHEKHMEAMQAALDDNDYEAFKALMADTPMADSLTEEHFAKLVEIRELEQSGDKEGAMELRKELKGEGGFMIMGMGGEGHHMVFKEIKTAE